ncbi:hypothetical protein EMIHUDRAFT_198523 [Emiliania huxleyi CCMP1516]|uniref:Carboxypeptidase n=4 Tax=Emiliania huxleyi TaxID=2903 RepID=A0A0D3I7F6_EMIH1|nr:hypothetical protein EMIHUDRAFT_198523 [Emiliania huxleyi CCMP1516]EOD07191.1 hypothetical protein EMIHUDRAFT_198523 [Emiliania huxleyi CCMP1516]|eukprot:XP_005759620.1 hypothetical protein EMIHUDRAFT_198523 [Emiliania huxleyi CCMP1516]
MRSAASLFVFAAWLAPCHCFAPAPDAPSPLLLTPMLEAGKALEAREVSKVVIDGAFKGHAGYLSVASASGKRTNHLWFWYQPCRNGCTHGEAILTQYFAGGPGSGSQGPAFNEMGNFFVDDKGLLQDRCYSWCLDNDCLFVDNPIQAGLSYQVDEAGEVVPLLDTEWANSEEGTRQQVAILLQVYKLFPELKPAPFWITGESYAGNYCPWFAKAVLAHNAAAADDAKINLKGLSVGDPCLGWSVQTKHYGDYLWATGLIHKDGAEKIDELFASSREHLKDNNCPAFFAKWNSVWNDDGAFDGAPDFLFETLTGSTATDIILVGGGRDAQGNYQDFLARHSKAMHFDGTPAADYISDGSSLGGWFTTKRKAIYKAYVESGDFCQETAPMYFTELLPAGLDIHIYSSNMDALLGPHTTEPGITMGLEAAGLKEDFYEQKRTIWKRSPDSRQPVGYSRCAALGGRFCYSVIRNAGHETPMFQPASAYDMTKRFFDGRAFDNSYHDPNPPVCTLPQKSFDVSIAGYEIDPA